MSTRRDMGLARELAIWKAYQAGVDAKYKTGEGTPERHGAELVLEAIALVWDDAINQTDQEETMSIESIAKRRQADQALMDVRAFLAWIRDEAMWIEDGLTAIGSRYNGETVRELMALSAAASRLATRAGAVASVTLDTAEMMQDTIQEVGQ